MRYLILLFLLSCGQANEASHCLFNGTECRDESPTPEKGDRGDVGPSGKDGEFVIGPMGPAGADGSDGTRIEPMTVCPLMPGAYPEVLLCIDDELFAVFNDSGTTTRYVKVPPGVYRTTDTRRISFRVINACEMECL